MLCINTGFAVSINKINMSSAILYPEVIHKYLQEEVESKQVMEVPLSVSDKIHISRFGAIPKKR